MSTRYQRRELAREIAQNLDELNKDGYRFIRAIALLKGRRFTNRLYEETLKIEADGGMLREDSSGRRTPGGVFLKLAKNELTELERHLIFSRQWIRKEYQLKAWELELTSKIFMWQHRQTAAKKLFRNKGKADEVTITLKGRPKNIVRRQGLVALTLVVNYEQMSFPIGLPKNVIKEVPYTIFIDSSQWSKANIDKKLENPEDVLIVQGVPMLDTEIEGITVFAEHVTTRLSKKGPVESTQV